MSKTSKVASPSVSGQGCSLSVHFAGTAWLFARPQGRHPGPVLPEPSRKESVAAIDVLGQRVCTSKHVYFPPAALLPLGGAILWPRSPVVQPMSLELWIPALFSLGVAVMGLMLAFVVACDKV